MSDERTAIETLIYAYAERLDAGDFDGVADLFAQATVRTDGRPAVRRGRDEVRRMYDSAVQLHDGSPCTKHVTTNVVIDLAPDHMTGSARSYFTVLQARPELPLQVVIAGRYHDRFARAAGGWHFTERVIYVDLVGDLRFHVKPNSI